MWVENIVLKIFSNLIINALSGLIDKFSVVLNNVFTVSEEVVGGEFVKTITSYTFKLSVAILTFMAIAQIIKLYILPEGDGPEEDMGGFFTRLMKSAILVSFSSYICTAIITLSHFIANDILTLISGKVEMSKVMQEELKNSPTTSFGLILAVAIIIIVVLACLIIIAFQAGIRGCNLAVLQMVAPIFATNYITTEKALWNKWVQNIMSVSFTYVFQIVLTNISLKFFVTGFLDIKLVFAGICWLIVTIQSPKLLKEFVYSTGVGSGIAKGGSSLMQVVRIMK